MLLVVERREDPMLPPPADAAPRSTERALRHMAWPFPVNDYTAPLPAPRRPVALPAKAPAPVPRRLPTLRPAVQESALTLEVAGPPTLPRAVHGRSQRGARKPPARGAATSPCPCC
jgi:hypothetical protein